jgi:hypothetical protein
VHHHHQDRIEHGEVEQEGMPSAACRWQRPRPFLSWRRAK